MTMTVLARLGRDAEVRYTPKGDAVANLALAYEYGRKGDDGKRPTQWLDGSLWGKAAESLAEYLTKGKLLCVLVDEVHIETYKKNDGSEGTKLVGRVMKVQFAGGPANSEQQEPARQAAPQRQAQQPAARQPAQQPMSDEEDQIPF